MSLLSETTDAIVPQDATWRSKATERLNQLTMPHWALGRLMDLAVDLSGMTRSVRPAVARKAIVTMAGSELCGAYIVDKAVLIPTCARVESSRWKRQLHLRRDESYFLVWRFDANTPYRKE